MEAHYTITSVLAVIVGSSLASFKSLFTLLLGINGNSFSRSLQQRVLSTIWLACLAWILQGLPFLPIVGIWLEGWDSMAGANRWSIMVVLEWSILRAFLGLLTGWFVLSARQVTRNEVLKSFLYFLGHWKVFVDLCILSEIFLSVLITEKCSSIFAFCLKYF